MKPSTRQKLSVAAAAALTLAALSACNGGTEEVSKAVSIKLDSELAKEDADQVRKDVSRLMEYKLSAEPGGYYEGIFGGRDATAALRFLDDRVNYVLSPDSKFLSRLRVDGSGVPFFLRPLLPNPAREPGVLAMNVSSALYVMKLTSNSEIALKVGGELIPVTSPRVGIIQLGKSYVQTAKGGFLTPQMEAPFRISTLVHEARHSDCVGGMSQGEVDRMKEDSTYQPTHCGQLHVNCPAGHELAGYPACDAQPWGAYTVGMFLVQEIARSCANCTEAERQQALVKAADAATRVLVFEDMMSGKLGKPDMSSSDEVRRNDRSVRTLKKSLQKVADSGQSPTLELIESAAPVEAAAPEAPQEPSFSHEEGGR